MPTDHLLKQVSLFSENKPGQLAAFARAMEEDRIDILAFSIAEAEGFGVIRALVTEPERALKKLSEMGYMVRITEVVGVHMKDRPGGLREVADILGDAKINIDYSYAFSGRHGAVLVLRVDKPKEAVERLRGKGIPLLMVKDLG
ncbi:MAG TPA: ACT domain-containing protein [Methanomassiliicoccales archaeon]|nr:ACT domain-containing protein [Methanomassiliicoccales archaeon]